VPLHVWLPKAHARRRDGVGADVRGHGNLGIYGIFSWAMNSRGRSRWWWLLVSLLGVVSALYGPFTRDEFGPQAATRVFDDRQHGSGPYRARCVGLFWCGGSSTTAAIAMVAALLC